MKIRIRSLLIVFFTALTLALSAQETTTGFILFEDGERVELRADAEPEALEAFLFSLLDSPKDGRCEVVEDGKVTFVLEKKGDQISAIAGGEARTMSVTEAKENFAQAKAQGQLTHCKSNQKNIATALEMYCVDHDGVYPGELSALTPDYLRMVPTCPTGDGSAKYSYKQIPDPVFFQLQCHGDHAKVGLSKGLPAYNGESGIIESADQLKK